MKKIALYSLLYLFIFPGFVQADIEEPEPPPEPIENCDSGTEEWYGSTREKSGTRTYSSISIDFQLPTPVFDKELDENDFEVSQTYTYTRGELK